MRNVLVTGGSRGIGLAVAKRLAGAGYQVVALGRSEPDPLKEAIEAADGRIRFAKFDLADLEGIPDLVRGLKTDLGPMWGLVNNAGLGTDGLLANLHVTQIEAVIKVNVTAPIVLTKHVVRSMMTEGGGRIINMSSITGHTGFNGLSVYGATKAAMIGFTKSLAREVGRLNITVNAIAPGFIETDMTAGMGADQLKTISGRSALKRLAEVEDVAAVTEFLLGDDARNITGTVTTVDAGNTA